MDHIRVAKIENVMLQRGTHQLIPGTVHLMPHQLLFRPTSSDQEIWVCYSSINMVDRRFTNTQGLTPIHVACKHFLFVRMLFTKEQDAQDVFYSLQKLINISSVENLYAFQFKLPDHQVTGSGFTVFDPEVEFARMGLGTKTKAWRLTTINKDYSFCSTYPRTLGVPSRISDNVLKHAGKFRSKARIPVLSYIHRTNMVSITRSAQPLAGLKQNRSIQDEKLVESIFQTGDVAPTPGHLNLIIDARPSANAIAQTALGAGFENAENYRGCKILFSGIENIHVMRDSLSKLMEAIQSSESGSALRSSMDKSGWLKHVKAVMDGAIMIVQNIHLLNNPVLVHCSDGWDRTAQLCSLSEMCLDPFYRTMKGFQVLIEKEWASFGFKFRDRLGLLTKENREGGDRPSVGAQIQAASKNVGFSITSAAKNLLTKTGAGGSSSSNVSSYSTSYYPSSNGGYPSSNPYGASSGPQGSAEITTPNTIHPKEVSPVFTQFLDCAYQLWTQFPTHFEFNEKFLIAINTHIYSCQFGNFLFNCERERLSFTYRQPGGPTVPLDRATNSIWDYFDANKDEYLNPLYIPPDRRKEEMHLAEANSTRGAGTGAVGIGASLGAPGSISEDGDVLFPSSSNPRYWVGMLFKGEEDYVDTEISNPGLEPGAGGSSSSTSTRYGSTSGPSRSARTSSIARASSTSLSQTYINTDRDQVPSATPAVTGTSGQKLFPPSNTQQWSSTPSANPRSLATDEPDIMSTPATSAHIGNSMVESITMGMNSLAGSVKTFAANVDFNPWNMGGSGASRPPSSADTYRTDDGVNMVDPKTLMVAPIGEDKTTVGGLSSIERKLEELSLARAAAKRDAATSATASWEQTDAAKQEQPDEERRKERPMEVVSLDESTVDGDEFTEEVLVAAGGNIVEVSATTPVQKPMQITNMPHPLWIP